MHDLGFIGQPWTFDNRQADSRNVKVRLDRAVATPSWSNWFPNALVRHIASSRSDHCPIVFELAGNSSARPGPEFQGMN
jgi:exonuclease III